MAIELKRLTEKELELMMNWRMRQDITKMMFTDVKLTLEEQKNWYDRIKDSEEEIRWVIWNNEKPVGSMYVVDIDRTNRRCESGWFVAEKNGLDLKSTIALQQNLCDYIFDRLNLNRVYGLVLDDNKYLVRLLQMCGINKEGILKEHVYKNGKYHDVYCVGLTKEEWNRKKGAIEYEQIKIE